MLDILIRNKRNILHQIVVLVEFLQCDWMHVVIFSLPGQEHHESVFSLDKPWMSGYLTSTLRPYLIVELLVSVPAKNRFITVDTRLS